MSRNKYLIIVAGLFLGIGFLSLVDGKSVFPMAVNPSSLLADAHDGYGWDYAATQQAGPWSNQQGYYGGDNSGNAYSYPSTVDSPETSQTVVNWGNYFMPPDSYSNFQTPYTQQLIDNERIWTSGGDTNVSVSDTVNASDQYTVITESYSSPAQPRSLGAPSVPDFYPGVMDWTIRPQPDVIQLGTSADSDVPPRVGYGDFLRSATKITTSDRQSAPFVESAAPDPALNAYSRYQGGPFLMGGGDSSGINKIIDNNGIHFSSLSDPGSGQPQGLVRQVVTGTSNYLLGADSFLGRLIGSLNVRKISGGAFVEYRTSF